MIITYSYKKKDSGMTSYFIDILEFMDFSLSNSLIQLCVTSESCTMRLTVLSISSWRLLLIFYLTLISYLRYCNTLQVTTLVT